MPLKQVRSQGACSYAMCELSTAMRRGAAGPALPHGLPQVPAAAPLPPAPYGCICAYQLIGSDPCPRLPHLALHRIHRSNSTARRPALLRGPSSAARPFTPLPSRGEGMAVFARCGLAAGAHASPALYRILVARPGVCIGCVCMPSGMLRVCVYQEFAEVPQRNTNQRHPRKSQQTDGHGQSRLPSLLLLSGVLTEDL